MSTLSYELILFDLDGTLLDFEASEEFAIQICWKRYFEAAFALEKFAKDFRALSLQIWREVEAGSLKPDKVSYERAWRTLKHFGLSTRDADGLGQLYASGLSKVAQWMLDAEIGFQRIADRHKVGLITNGLSEVQNPRIDAIGIRNQLMTIQISEEARTMKPRKEIFLKAIDEAGGRIETTLMVGDSVSSDYQGAINAGIDFCWMKEKDRELPYYMPSPRFHVSSILELNKHLS